MSVSLLQISVRWQIGPHQFPYSYSQQQILAIGSSSQISSRVLRDSSSLAVGSVHVTSPLSSRVSCYSSSLAVGSRSPLWAAESRVTAVPLLSDQSTSLTLLVAECCVSAWHQFWINPRQFPSQQQSLMIRTPEETHTLQETHTWRESEDEENADSEDKDQSQCLAMEVDNQEIDDNQSIKIFFTCINATSLDRLMRQLRVYIKIRAKYIL